MTPAEFVHQIHLPSDWEQILEIELLTGCSQCGRRLLEDDTVRRGVTIVQVLIEDTVEAAFIRCEQCSTRS